MCAGIARAGPRTLRGNAALAFKQSSKLNIPIPLTSFIGREKELKEIADLLSKSRLVTLTGSGGVGKTRLAIQVVADVLERFPDGVWFLDLAPLERSNPRSQYAGKPARIRRNPENYLLSNS